MGVENVNLYFLAIARSCLNVELSLTSPNGAMPISLMLLDLSGITFFMSTSCDLPRPLHDWQVPYGELNEKLLGDGIS